VEVDAESGPGQSGVEPLFYTAPVERNRLGAIDWLMANVSNEQRLFAVGSAFVDGFERVTIDSGREVGISSIGPPVVDQPAHSTTRRFYLPRGTASKHSTSCHGRSNL
jgi:hypothetical protein